VDVGIHFFLHIKMDNLFFEFGDALMAQNVPLVQRLMATRGDEVFAIGLGNNGIRLAISNDNLPLLQAIVGTRRFLDDRVLTSALMARTPVDILRFIVERSPAIDENVIDIARRIPGAFDLLEQVSPGITARIAEQLEEELSIEEEEAIRRATSARRYNEHLRAGTLDDEDRAWWATESARLRQNTMVDVPRPSVVLNNEQFLQQLVNKRAIPRLVPEGTEDTTLVEIENRKEYALCINNHPTLIETLEGYCAQTNTPCNICPLCRASIIDRKYINM